MHRTPQVGSCKGMKVCDAKPVIRQELLDAGHALVYYEPESLVRSLSFYYHVTSISLV
jgi:hypothetical protein